MLGLQFSIMNIIQNKYSIFELGINHPGEMKDLIKTLILILFITCMENSHIGNFKNFNNLIKNKLDILILKSYKGF